MSNEFVEEKKNTGLIVLVVILSLLVVGLGGYVVYDKFFSENEMRNKESNNENVSDEEEENNDVNKMEENVTVSTAFSYHGSVKYKGSCFEEENKTVDVNIDIPKINSSKQNALKLNQQIANFCESAMNVTKDSVYDQNNQVIIPNVEYSSLIRNGYVYILLTKTNPGYCSSGHSDYKNYFYDIKNDKILTMEEGFKSAGFTLQDLRDSDEVNSDITFEQCENSACGCGLEIVNDKLTIFGGNFQCA